MGVVALSLLVTGLFVPAALLPRDTPQAVVDDLLAADRGYAKAAAARDVTAALTAMMADDVVVPVPRGGFARGIPAVKAAMAGNPDNATGRVDWTPVRAGISSDGQHGFTFGYMRLRKADKTEVPIKYLAYWVKSPAGWKVAVYKRTPSGPGEASMALRAPALPTRIVPAVTDAAIMKAHRHSLDAVERAFSDEAQTIGLGPAFAKYGRADAVNGGGPTTAEFVTGSEAIGRAVSGGATDATSPVTWGPDSVIVASSGDLGVTIGFIKAKAPGPDGQVRPPSPFFTIWWRASPQDPWRYIAE